MCMDDYEFWNQKKVNKDRERNEANDAAVYARKGSEIARTYIPEDTAEYVICANYPGEKDFEVLGVGTNKFALELGLKMDRNVNILCLWEDPVNITFDKKDNGILIQSSGFQVEIQPNGAGVHVQYYGTVPRKLKYVIEKHKNLFVNPDLARTLICNEISHL